MRLDEKKQIVDELRDKFSRSKVVIVTDYKGLDVARITDLRRQLQEAGVEYRVVKNTLLVRASEETEAAAIQDVFKGPSAVAFAYDDPVPPAKVLTQFAKDNEKLEIKGGVMSGKVLSIDDVKALSKLPSREVLLAQLLMTMNAVPTGLVQALADVPRRFLNVVQAIKEQKEAA